MSFTSTSTPEGVSQSQLDTGTYMPGLVNDLDEFIR